MESMSSMSSLSASDGEIKPTEYLKYYCRLGYHPRILKNKGAIMVIVWNFMVAFTNNYIIWNVFKVQSDMVHFIVCGIVGILLPIAGWLADVQFGRYKVICWSVWTIWISSMVLAMSYVMVDIIPLHIDYSHTHQKIVIVLVTLIKTGVGGFQANIIQFGVDQLPDASTTEITSFISWFVWSITSSHLLVLYFTCICNEFRMIGLLLMCGSISLVVSTNFIFKKHLIKEPVTQNPFKLIFKVVGYAIRNKRPRQRSAFTFHEDQLPSRIDFGKHKYGGPFTTEQVEDVKTFFKAFLFICIVCVLIAMMFYHRVSGLEIYLTNSKLYSDMLNRKSDCLTLDQCIRQNFLTSIYCICGTAFIPLYEILIFPIFNRCLKINSYWKVLLGCFFQLGGYIVLTVLIIYSKKVMSTYANNNHNVTTYQCLFYEGNKSVAYTFDYKWFVFAEIPFAIAEVCYLVGSIEFFCAQIPYTMKGLVAGCAYGLITLFVSFNVGLFYIFKIRFNIWKRQSLLNCEFWYLQTKTIPTFIVLLLFGLAITCYKRRKREDVLPNEHFFAEQYYSKNH